MILLGLGNKARNGKDSVAQALVDYYNSFPAYSARTEFSIRQFQFATALYQECRQHHNMVGKDAPMLQRVGMERRLENPNYWIDQCFSTIPDDLNIAVISDVRYTNEAEYIRKRGGYLINVARLNNDGTQFIAADRPADHPSEVDLDDFNWDFHITARTGEQELAGELGITIVEFIRKSSKILERYA